MLKAASNFKQPKKEKKGREEKRQKAKAKKNSGEIAKGGGK